MSMHTFVRRSAYVAVGGGVYIIVAGLTYNHFLAENRCQGHNHDGEAATPKDSYITRPDRARRFDELATTYDNKIGLDETMMGMNWLRKSLIYFNAKGNVIEIGAGTGRNIEFYPSDGIVSRVLLTDTSEEMLSVARNKVFDYQKKNGTEKIKFGILNADSESLKEYIPDDAFDTVIDTFGLCSYNDPVKVLKEMNRICNKTKDSKILLLEHGRSKTWDWISKYLDNNAERHAKNWGCVWNRDIDDIIRQSGLQIERLHTWHFGTTYYVVCRPCQTKNE